MKCSAYCLNRTDFRNQYNMYVNFAGIKSTKDYFQTFFKSEKASYFIIR